jgi:hypothetical protein
VGTIGSADVKNVGISCQTTGHRVEGTVSGLMGTGLVLVDNGADPLPIGGNGTFGFGMRVSPGQPYSVTVKTQPTGQKCTVQNGSGTMGNMDVTTVTVTCTNSGPSTFTISGTVTGSGGGKTTLANGTTTTVVTGDTSFMFTANGGSMYDVRVITPPTGFNCTVSSGTGTLTANVTDVHVTCMPGGPTCPAGYFVQNGHCARKYYIQMDGLQALPNSCGTGVYTTFASGPYGFTWTDELPTPTSVVNFVEIDFVVGANSSPDTQPLKGFLNGDDIGFGIDSPPVSCASNVSTLAQFMPIPLGTYKPGAQNFFLFNAPTSDAQYGFNKSTDPAWSGAYARIYVVY